ncbi:MAG TPA: 50S ribosomal protein L24 [Armatimonadota bacterium]
MDIKKGDEVLVLAGKDASYKGHQKRGKVIGALPAEGRLLVEGVNIIKRAVRQNQRMRQGGIISSPGHIDRSNVMLICPSCDKPTRIGHRRNDKGDNQRICKKCDKVIE